MLVDQEFIRASSLSLSVSPSWGVVTLNVAMMMRVERHGRDDGINAAAT